jgi:hypothetical protein
MNFNYVVSCAILLFIIDNTNSPVCTQKELAYGGQILEQGLEDSKGISKV